MRYAQGGGLTAAARARREALRFEAAELLVSGLTVSQVAARFRVTPRSVRRWKAVLADGGRDALVSLGVGGPACRLDEGQLKTLGQVLDEGPAAYGWVEDQRWTLPRMAQVIWELFRERYTPRGVSYLVHRLGYSPQVPQHVAAERDEAQVATWVKETWPHIKVLPPGSGPGSSSRTRPGARCARPRPARGPAVVPRRGSRSAARAQGGSRWPG
jgi:transposase